MRNEYLFFTPQHFEGFELEEYVLQDISIPKTDIHIYSFSCKSENDADGIVQAKKLDELSAKFQKSCPDNHIIVLSESSQFFCIALYPLFVNFETKLRKAIYISEALCKNVELTRESFGYQVRKEKKHLEEMDFQTIYEVFFVDNEFDDNFRDLKSLRLSKNDLIARIRDIDENTLWQKLTKETHSYIEKHFLEIKEFRNHVMHNHILNYETYIKILNVLQEANKELEQVIGHVLVPNRNEYLNEVSLFDAISGAVTFIKLFAAALDKLHNIEISPKVISMFGTDENTLLSISSPDKKDELLGTDQV